MALLRYLAPAVLVPALMAGCSQSLFDDLSGDGNDGDPDGSVLRPDARPGHPDAGPMPVPDGGGPGEPDGGTLAPDAAVPQSCYDPCVGDAFEEFASKQGGMTGLWGYVDVHTEVPGGLYVDMFSTTFAESISGWQGSGMPAPTIALCNTPVPESPCAELQGVLALTTVAQPDFPHRPGLRWTAPADGFYYVTGNWHGSTQVEGVKATLRFTLNDEEEENEQHVEEGELKTSPQPFQFLLVNMVAGDKLGVTARADSDESVSIGLDLFIAGPINPAAPQ